MQEKKYQNLSEEEQRVILRKGTESPHTGAFNVFKEEGVFTCRQCGTGLYLSSDKFNSNCGWPSFDDEIEDKVAKLVDADGRRIEIVCKACDGHLGHVFEGEGFTPKNTRHCVNSVSMDFVPAKNIKKAYFAAGCFWGVEYFFDKAQGVLYADSGYMGGHTENPTYQDICYKNTGHLEVVEVVYDTKKTTFENLSKLFFELHDETQTNGQGPDLGEQYLSAIFYHDEDEKEKAQILIHLLMKQGRNVATSLRPMVAYYKAETYHQNYYEKNGNTPYCHTYVRKF